MQLDPALHAKQRLPEHTLWAAVLINSLREAARGDLDAIDWINSDHDSGTFRSFEWVCSILSIDFKGLRKEITENGPEHYCRLRNFGRK